MIRRPNTFGAHESNAELRYAEVYAIDTATVNVSGATNASPIVVTTSAAHGLTTGDQVAISSVGGNVAANGTWIVTVTDTTHFSLDDSTGSGVYTTGGTVGYAQPVRVKFLRWNNVPATGDPKVYETYNGTIRVGDETTSEKFQVGDNLWVVWRTDSHRWEVIGGSEKFRLIRGRSYGIQSGATILIDAVVVLAGGLDPSDGNPATQVTVLNLFSQAFADNEWVDAVYSPEASVGVDWETLKSGGSTTGSPLRRFELTSDKATTEEIAYGRFLDDDDIMVGVEVSLYDPMLKFYGQSAASSSDGVGFRGIALQRTDLGGVEDDRWEIVNMEGFADWAILQYAGSPDNEWQLYSFGNTDPWNHKLPAIVDANITVADPLSVLGSPASGDRVIGVLSDPDTSPPTYQVRERVGGQVKCTADDSTASFLHDAIEDNTSFVYLQDAIVASATNGAGGTNQKERLFVDVSLISGWSPTTIQLLGHNASGDLKWDSVANWLNTLSGYSLTDIQSIGHDASGSTEWQDDGTCT